MYMYPFHVFRFDFTTSTGPTLWLEDIFLLLTLCKKHPKTGKKFLALFYGIYNDDDLNDYGSEYHEHY